ncbi:MAG: TonB-dependent receptor, partial [Desulfarculaceae bacterium]
MRSWKIVVAGVCLMVLCCASPVWAAEKAPSVNAAGTVVNEMVVTATRTGKKADEAPASVTLVTREDMERLHIETLDEALQHVEGLFVKRAKGLIESLPSVSMRGLYGQERTLVLLDGVPMNRGYASMVAWNMVAMDNVERIEVIRGPASALYGGNAMAGVINIITSLPQKTEIGARMGYGTNETYSTAAYVGDRYERFSIRVGAEYEETAGYVNNLVTRSVSAGDGDLQGGYGATNVSGSPVWVVGDKGDQPASRYNINFTSAYNTTDTGQVRLNYQMGDHKYDYDNPNTYLTGPDGREAWKGTVNAGDGLKATVSPYNYVYYGGKAEEKFYLPSLTYRERFGRLGFKGVLGYQHWHKMYTVATGYGDSNYDDSVGTRSDTWTNTWTLDLQGDITVFEKHLLTFGLYGRSDEMSQEDWNLSYYRNEDSKTTKNKIAEGNDLLYAFYIQDEWRLLPSLTLYGGLRLDCWKAYNGKAGNVGEEMSFDEPDDSAISPKISAVWNPLADTFIRASVGRAFRAPNLYELYRTWPSSSYINYSNPNLSPETLWNYEIGGDQYFWDRKIKVSMTLFHTDVEDA